MTSVWFLDHHILIDYGQTRIKVDDVIDGNIKRLQPPPPQFLLSVERITKLILKKCGAWGGGGGRGSGHIIIMIFGHLS